MASTKLQFTDLREAAQVCLTNWSYLTVRDEPLVPLGQSSGETAAWISTWDNWVLPPDPYGLDPLITQNGVGLIQGTDYVISQAGDAVRGIITLGTGSVSSLVDAEEIILLDTPGGQPAACKFAHGPVLMTDSYLPAPANPVITNVGATITYVPGVDYVIDATASTILRLASGAIVSNQEVLASYYYNAITAVPVGLDTITLATFTRSMFRNIFWANNFRHAIRDIEMRLLRKCSFGFSAPLELDDQCDPWHIIVKQASKNALINLQTFLAGLGKMTVDSVTVDLSRAHNMIHQVIDDLDGDIDRDVVAWRWQNSPMGRRAPWRPMALPGPWTLGAWY
jgi:hypothetical protein